MSLYRLKITPRKNPDIYRIIEIIGIQHFEVLHRAIIKSMKFTEGELASFYINYDEPDKQMEICLSDIQSDDHEALIMKQVKIADIFTDDNKKITYVYDFMNFWIFDIELIEVLSEKKTNIIYPHIAESVGTALVQEDSDEELKDEDALLVAEIMKKNKGIFDDELMSEFDSDEDDEDLGDFRDDDDENDYL